MSEHTIDLAEAETNLLAAATYLAENIKSADGRTEAIKEIVSHYLDKNEVDLAAQLADSIEDTFTRDRLLCDVAEKCAELDDDEYALQLADAIEDYNFQSLARERIAVHKAQQNELEQAFELVESLPHASDALVEIARRQVINGDEATALETISRIEFHVSKINALQLIATHFQSAGDAEKARELLSRATLEAREIEFPEEKIRALHSIAAHYIEAQQFDRAIEILADARGVAETLDGAHRDSFLTLISQDFLKSGSLDLADRTLDLVKDKTEIASCLAGFATEFDVKGERANALESLEESYAILKSQKPTEVRDSKARFSVFGAIAVRFALLERGERAVEIALENPVESERHAALTQIARICVFNGRDGLARQALDEINEDSARMSALIELGDAKKKAGQNDEALRYLNEAETLSESVRQFAARSEALNELTVRFHEYGETEKARAVSLGNLLVISRILDESQRAISLADMAQTYENLGFHLNEAERSILSTMLRKANW